MREFEGELRKHFDKASFGTGKPLKEVKPSDVNKLLFFGPHTEESGRFTKRFGDWAQEQG